MGPLKIVLAGSLLLAAVPAAADDAAYAAFDARIAATRARSPASASPTCSCANTAPRRSTPRRKAVRAAGAEAAASRVRDIVGPG